MTTTTEASTERCDVCGWRQEDHPRGEWCDAHQPRAIGITEASTEPDAAAMRRGLREVLAEFRSAGIGGDQ